MINLELAKIFFEIADIMEMMGVEWKPRAFRNAARNIETYSKDLKDVYKKDGIKGLKEIPGVGEGIAKKIEEYVKTGKVKEFEQLRKKIPAGVEEMMHLQGMGPKKAWQLFKKLKIKNLAELKKAAVSGKIAKLPGFGKKTADDIIRGIALYRGGKERLLLGQALPIARELEADLKKLKEVKQVSIAGSIRRMRETVKDIDILVVSTNPKKVMDYFTTMPRVKRVLAKGSTRSAVVLKEGLNSDLRVIEAKSFGAAMQYFTGSKDHNVKLRQIAIKKGYKLNEYGIFKNKKYIVGKTEKEVYAKLGLPYIEPELRENTGEIGGKLPELVKLSDIKGDLHMHTTYTDGANSPELMIKTAIDRGYQYMAITDHSKSTYVAGGMDEKTIKKYIVDLTKLKKKYAGKIKVLIGSEVDILADGKLDYSNDILKKLDWVVASVHSGFKKSKQENTDRVLKALSNPHVNAIGHPTGRLINKREPFQIDLDKVFSAAKQNNVAMEINSFPSRLDLKDVHVKNAIENKVKLVVNTDSHSTEHFRYMKFGIATARRGWAQSKDVINTLPWKKFERFIKK